MLCKSCQSASALQLVMAGMVGLAESKLDLKKSTMDLNKYYKSQVPCLHLQHSKPTAWTNNLRDTGILLYFQICVSPQQCLQPAALLG